MYYKNLWEVTPPPNESQKNPSAVVGGFLRVKFYLFFLERCAIIGGKKN